MKICYLGNNVLGLRILGWLAERGCEEIAALVLHRPEDGRLVDELTTLGQKLGCAMFDAPSLAEPATLDRIKALGCDMAVSVFYGYRLLPDFLDMFPKGCINLHPSYLPYNRGAYPNVWSIVESTPAGATLHYIDEGLDTGAIIAQRLTVQEPWDTGESLYAKLLDTGYGLFTENWQDVVDGTVKIEDQVSGEGSFHLKKDVDGIDYIDLDKTYKAADLINILRARTFPPFKGAYFVHNGKKVYVNLELEPEE